MNFKLSQKPIHKDARSSIEYLHDEKIKNLENYYDTIDVVKDELNNLTVELELVNKNKQYGKIVMLKDEIKKKEDELYHIENKTELTEYLFNAVPFIIDKEPVNIKKNLDQLNSISNNDISGDILKYINIDGKSEKGSKYADYLEACFEVPNLTKQNKENMCKNCKSSERTIDTREAIIVCNQCGLCEKYDDFDFNKVDWSRADSVEYIQVFTYKRKNHFKEWLIQLQAKESTNIPQEIIEAIYKELKKERITEINDITYNRIRQYLKKLRYNKYYEHVPNIIKIITKQQSLKIDTELENKLMLMFDQIQEPFRIHCPKNRKNFLSYSFTLHKFCQLLNRYDLLIYFPLLKSREKLFEQEKIWKKICEELDWEYISTI